MSRGCPQEECCCFFDLEFHEEGDLVLDFGEVIEIDHGFVPYEGPYNVIPKWHRQQLNTNDKSMTDNVEVEEIPLVKTSNVAGGYTVIIGG